MSAPHRIAALALLLLGIGGPASAAPIFRPGKPAAGPAQNPNPAAGPKIDVGQLDVNAQLRHLRVGVSPRLNAVALSALRRFADAAPSPNPLDRAVAKALGKMRGGRKIAQRIVGRLDALAPAARTAAFGTADTKGKPGKLDLDDAMKDAGVVTASVGMMPVGALPAEVDAAPTSFHFGVTGLAGVEAAEADGDEVLAMVTFVRCCTGEPFKVTTVAVPVVEGVAAGTVSPLDATLFDGSLLGSTTEQMVFSAVFEADDDAPAARDEYMVMVGLAQGMAETLSENSQPTKKQLENFLFALDYATNMLRVSAPDRWQAGSLQRTMLSGNASFAALHATTPSTDGAVKWKLAHDHDLAKGRYKLYFDVPAPPVVKPNVKVALTYVQSVSPEADGDDLVARIKIKDASTVRWLRANDNTHSPAWTVARKVNVGGVNDSVSVVITLGEVDRGPAWDEMSSYEKALCAGLPEDALSFDITCPEVWSWIDISPRAVFINDLHGDFGRDVLLNVDLTTGAISGDVKGKVGDALTLEGKDAPRGKIKLVITTEGT